MAFLVIGDHKCTKTKNTHPPHICLTKHAKKNLKKNIYIFDFIFDFGWILAKIRLGQVRAPLATLATFWCPAHTHTHINMK